MLQGRFSHSDDYFILRSHVQIISRIRVIKRFSHNQCDVFKQANDAFGNAIDGIEVPFEFSSRGTWFDTHPTAETTGQEIFDVVPSFTQVRKGIGHKRTVRCARP